MRLLAALPAACLLLGTSPARPAGEATLAVRAARGWETWWRASDAPAKWERELPALADHLRWKHAQPGLDWGELSLSGSGEAFRVRLIVARLDPRLLELRVVQPGMEGLAARWSVDEAPADAVLALNAGQFSGAPWGWVVSQGTEAQRPGRGPLAPGVVVAADGTVQLVPPDSIVGARAVAREAFQSYPTLLERDGEIPAPLRTGGLGVDLAHRDARLALGLLRDGRVLVAMTRFEGLGGVLDNLPLGLTTPEMAAVMGALGSRRAVLLDGGISSQLMLRDGAERRLWSSWRRVALGLVAVPRRAT